MARLRGNRVWAWLVVTPAGLCGPGKNLVDAKKPDVAAAAGARCEFLGQGIALQGAGLSEKESWGQLHQTATGVLSMIRCVRPLAICLRGRLGLGELIFRVSRRGNGAYRRCGNGDSLDVLNNRNLPIHCPGRSDFDSHRPSVATSVM